MRDRGRGGGGGGQRGIARDIGTTYLRRKVKRARLRAENKTRLISQKERAILKEDITDEEIFESVKREGRTHGQLQAAKVAVCSFAFLHRTPGSKRRAVTIRRTVAKANLYNFRERRRRGVILKCNADPRRRAHGPQRRLRNFQVTLVVPRGEPSSRPARASDTRDVRGGSG